MSRLWKSFEIHAKSVDFKGNLGEVSDRIEGLIGTNWTRGCSCGKP
jgi:hypothetical protein